MDFHEIKHAQIDDFCSGDLEELQTQAMLAEIRHYLTRHQIDMNMLIEKAIENTRAELSPGEKDRFLAKFIKKVHLEPKDGILTIQI